MAQDSDKATDAIIDEAADWIVRLSDPARSTNTDLEFSKWLRASPIHVQQYLRAEAIWQSLTETDSGWKVDLRSLLEEPTENVVPIHHGLDGAVAGSSGRGRLRNVLTGLSAATALVVVTLVWFLAFPPVAEFSTGKGEQRRIVLQDGSSIELNTQSLVEVDFNEAARKVKLISGEALFSVKKDPDRPFVVTSGVVEVKALGTRFNVYSQSDLTVVTVLEGRVALQKLGDKRSRSPVDPIQGGPDMGDSAVELAAGDQASVGVLQGTLKQEKANTQKAVAWRQRRLIFENNSLADVVAQFNRYNSKQLIIADEAIGAQAISGVFDADNPGALVQFLTRYAHVEAIEHDDSTVEIRQSR